MSGIDRSIRMALGRSLSAFSTASAPFAAVATRYPAYSKYSAYISRASWKSSTTRTSSPSPHLSLGLAGSPNLGVELAGGVASMCIGRRDDGKRIASGPAASRRRANGTDRRHIRVKCSILLRKLPSIAGPPAPPGREKRWALFRGLRTPSDHLVFTGARDLRGSTVGLCRCGRRAHARIKRSPRSALVLFTCERPSFATLSSQKRQTRARKGIEHCRCHDHPHRPVLA